MSAEFHLHGFGVAYQDRTWTLENIEFTAECGETIGIIGNNGSGKSTLANAVVGIIPHLIPGRVAGSVRVAATELVGTDLRTHLACVGYTFQDVESQLLFGTVRDVLQLGNGEGIPPLLEKAMMRMKVNHLLDRSPDELSGGEAQRVILLTALSRDPHPAVLIYDEATAALDPRAKQDFAGLISLLRENRITVLLLTQRASVVRPYCDRCVLLHHRRFVPYLDEHAPPSNAAETLWKELDNLLTAPPDPAPNVCLSNVFFRRHANFQMGPVSLNLNAGEACAILGPNGAGKTTLLLLLAGAIKKKGGKIALDGVTLGSRSHRALARIAELVTQSPLARIIGSSIEEEMNLSAAVRESADGAVVHARLREDFPFLDPARDPLELSFGQQRMVTLLASFVSPKPLVLMDEPEQGLDAQALDCVKSWVRNFSKQRRKILLFTTHDLAMAAELGDRCILMVGGKIVAETPRLSASELEAWYFEHTTE